MSNYKLSFKTIGLISQSALFLSLITLSPVYAQSKFSAPSSTDVVQPPPVNDAAHKALKPAETDPSAAHSETGGQKPATAVSQEMDLSLNSIVLFALSDNPDIKIGQAREKQAQANTGRANAKFYPLVDGVAEGSDVFNEPSGGTVSRNGNTDPASRVALSLRQLIYDGGLTNSTVKQNKALETSANLQTGLSEQTVLTDTIQYYLQILNYQQTLKETDNFVLRMRDLVHIITDMYEAGGTNKATLDYAKSRLAFAETQLNSVRSSMNDAISNLEFLTGKLPPFKAVPPDDLDPARMDLDYYKNISEKENLNVQLSDSDLKSLEYKLKAAKASYSPNFNFLLNGEQKYNDGGPIGPNRKLEATVQMNYRFYDGGDRKQQANLVKAQIEETQYSRQRTIKQLAREVKLAYNQVILLNESIKKTEQEVISSEALQTLNRENFKLGSINIIELVEGEERLNAARTRIYSLKSDLYTNTYNLLITTGILKKGFFCESCSSVLPTS